MDGVIVQSEIVERACREGMSRSTVRTRRFPCQFPGCFRSNAPECAASRAHGLVRRGRRLSSPAMQGSPLDPSLVMWRFRILMNFSDHRLPFSYARADP